jgi:exoribonuclease R
VPTLPVIVDPIDAALAAGLDAIRTELEIQDLPAAALAEAEQVAGQPLSATGDDLRDVAFVTIDPPGSRDLDQALHITADGDGWLVQYAIADLAAFVRPDGAIDQAARERGVTIYLPDKKSPLHPTRLSEGAASLLPGEDRPAIVWRIRLDGNAEIGDIAVRRARVRSRRAYSYDEVQAALDAGDAEPMFVLLRDAGRAREELTARRGGLDLRLPDQTVLKVGEQYELVYRAPLAVEGWNAQISLLAGECAARLMLDAGVGILRTLPPPNPGTVDRLRRHARALGVAWPDSLGYAEFVRSLDPAIADHAALIVQSAKLARGAGYLAFTERPADDFVHSAVAAPYAHVTAPLRRLVDRFANEFVLAASAGVPAAAWASAALAELPKLMDRARGRERAAERMVVSLAEAAVLVGYIGNEVAGVVVDVDATRDVATVQLTRPAVVADVALGDAAASLGDEVRLRVAAADPQTRTVTLERIASSG